MNKSLCESDIPIHSIKLNETEYFGEFWGILGIIIYNSNINFILKITRYEISLISFSFKLAVNPINFLFTILTKHDPIHCCNSRQISNDEPKIYGFVIGRE